MLSGGLAIPVGAFGSTRGPDGGCARRGGGIGLELTSRYAHGLEGGAALWVDINPSDSDGMSAIVNAELRRIFPSADELRIDAAQWYSGWLMGKGGYSPSSGGQHRAFVDGYGGIVVVRSPDFSITNVDTGYSIGPVAGDYLMGPAWGIGAGVRLYERISLGITYRAGYAAQLGARLGLSTFASVRLSLGYAYRI